MNTSEPSGAASAAPGKSRRRHGRRKEIFLWILVGALLVLGVVWLAATHADSGRTVDAGFIWKKLGKPIVRTSVFISIGLLLGQLIESLGWTTRLGRLVWPLINWARLPGAAGMAFTSAFVSGLVANTLLYTGFQEGRLNKRGMILANLLNGTIPAYVLHMPSTMMIIVSLLGKTGLIYVALTFAASLARFFGVVLISRAVMPVCNACELEAPPVKRPWGEVWTETWPKFRVRLRRVILIVIPVYLAVVLLAESGFFTWFRDALSGLITSSFVPVEAMSVIVFSVAAEFTSGFAAAGAMLQAGALSTKEVVLALLIGNIVATPIRALRHQLPHYLGIYSPGLGAQLLIISQSVRVSSIVLVIILFALFF